MEGQEVGVECYLVLGRCFVDADAPEVDTVT